MTHPPDGEPLILDLISYAAIVEAAQRLEGVSHQTPVVTSRTVDQLTDNQVFFKCENFQRSGSFKFRGAYNVLSQLSMQQRHQGVLAYSSGNHAQAVALAGQLLQIPVTVVMPHDAPAVKLDATRSYGAEVILYHRLTESRETIGQKLTDQRNLTLIPPFDDASIIAGQGTAAKELIEEVGSLDYLLVCCGGGGLLSGSAIAAQTLCPSCQVIGVEPKQADDATRSFYSRRLQTAAPSNTIADGARTTSLGQLTFPLILNLVQEMVTVSDAAIIRTMQFLWERLKLVVEPTGAVAATPLLEGIIQPHQARIGVILSGGNVDIAQVGKLVAQAHRPNRKKTYEPWARELS